MDNDSEAQVLVARRVLSQVLGNYNCGHFSVRLWDGSYWHPRLWTDGLKSSFTLVLNYPGSLRGMLARLSMLSLGKEYLAGSFDIEGDALAACELGDYLLRLRISSLAKLRIALWLRRLPKSNLPDEIHAPYAASGKIGSRRRLSNAIAYHYDLPIDFWKLWLDPTMAYSCAYFKTEEDSLDTAQVNKLDYVCRKLYLSKGEHLLDLGCGWGGLVLFAAQHYGVLTTGITLSRTQAEYGRHLIEKAGLQKQCEILHLDFRDYRCAQQFDKIACVGAVEHVPPERLPEFFEHAKTLLKPGGLFLNHGITTSAVAGLPGGASFVDAFVFPDNGVTSISRQLVAAENVGFEIRDVESLREHYIRTCSEWLRRIEENENSLAQQTSKSTQRLFRFYVAAQTYYFTTGADSIHQTLLAKSESKPARIPLTRAGWYNSSALNV